MKEKEINASKIHVPIVKYIRVVALNANMKVKLDK